MNSFEAIYKENYTKMFCVSKKMVNSVDVASDIVQEVFVYFFEKSKNGYEIHTPKSWLIRATINKCIDYTNKRDKFQDISTIRSRESEGTSFEDKEAKAIVHLALSKLKPQEKILATLYSEGFSYKEISEITKVKFSSIGKMLSRVLKKLKNELNNLKYELY